jgi:murein DD-endopeptidase MepM/ murein hydrolase activator NlpD
MSSCCHRLQRCTRPFFHILCPMENKKSFWRRLFVNLRSRYRIVIMNDTTFEEKASFSLTRLNVFIALSSLTVLLIFIGIALIVFTPVKEYLDGCNDVTLKNTLQNQMLRIDSLENQIRLRDDYLNSIKRVLSDSIDHTKPAQPQQSQPSGENTDRKASQNELALREAVEMGDQYTLSENASTFENGTTAGYLYMPPVKGTVTQKFDPREDHYAVDIVTRPNETVRATLDGTVIFAAWNPETGHVIAVQHSNNTVSVYKHNAVLLKKEGDFVRAGDAIAIVGNSGELTTGAHLHFELWERGLAVNPENFMVF